MIPTPLDKQLILNPAHNVGVSIELLDKNFALIDEIQGRVQSMSVSISATSDIRRTCSVVLGVISGPFNAENFEVEWLDKLVRVSIGLLHNGSYVWYLIGHFLLDTNAYAYDATTNELSLSLMDMMSAATDVRGSQIGPSLFFPYGSNVRNALIATVGRFSPFARYDIEEFPDVIPFDQEFQQGTYAHTILKQIVGLFPYYEMFYSPTGYFTVKKIPLGMDDPIFLDKQFMDAILIRENRSGKLGDIKNTTEIWGAELDATYATTDVSTDDGVVGEMPHSEMSIDDDMNLVATGDDSGKFYLINGELLYSGSANYSFDGGEMLVELESVSVGNTYVLTHSPPLESLPVGVDCLFVPDTDSVINQNIKVDGMEAAPLLNSDGTSLEYSALKAGKAYVVRYSMTGTGEEESPRFLLQGEWLIHVIVKEVNNMPSHTYIVNDKIRNDCNDIRYIVNPDSPYACDRNGMDYDDGEIRQVLIGGDYSMIYTTQLAYERAAYENWLKTRLQTEAEIECLLVPWMDVNVKIEYTSPVTGVARVYIVKEVQMNPANFTMTLKLSRFYPYYPWL